jgi:hypothetical protein
MTISVLEQQENELQVSAAAGKRNCGEYAAPAPVTRFGDDSDNLSRHRVLNFTLNAFTNGFTTEA